ncbi:MAG: sialate O-acetylesterase [Phycisphaera sp.]|nr:sialate O-acetylesterase [Phycisphaera sp.]
MNTKRWRGAWLCVLAWVCVGSVLTPAKLYADVPALPFVHPLFTDHMVMQRNAQDAVWGWASPGEKVTVSMAGKSAVATADDTGRWHAHIGPFEAGGPYTMTIEGKVSVTINDVLVGDVWLCSGQSNMQWTVGNSNNAQDEIDAADHPNIRLYSVPRKTAVEPQQTVDAHWETCTPQSIPGFSAVAYYFGKSLHEKLHVPIGLVHSSWGGTVAQAWTSAEALMTLDDFKPQVEQMVNDVQSRKSAGKDFDQLIQEWWAQNDPGSAQGWDKPGYDDGEWKTMAQPCNWREGDLKNFNGIVWFRLSVTLDEAADGQPAKLSLGSIDTGDTTYVNGVVIGQQDRVRPKRLYTIPAGVLKAGRNVIAIRVIGRGPTCGLVDDAKFLSLTVGDGKPISLAGDWKYQASTPMKDLTALPTNYGGNPNIVTVLYNGMISPLLPMSIKGAIWYQGESNAGNPMQYRKLLPTMIADWRKEFGQEFPFFIVQLANFRAEQKDPVESGWAELREAQLLTAQHDDKVGYAVIIDIGEANNIHPRNKQDVGKRLAQSALNIAYGQDVVPCGPQFESMQVKGNEAVLRFKFVGSGLMVKGDTLKGFAIAGDDKVFHFADAKIVGDTVVVSSPDVATPVAVRYGWANNPPCNLYNKEDLPATPFRTDVE